MQDLDLASPRNWTHAQTAGTSACVVTASHASQIAMSAPPLLLVCHPLVMPTLSSGRRFRCAGARRPTSWMWRGRKSSSWRRSTAACCGSQIS